MKPTQLSVFAIFILSAALAACGHKPVKTTQTQAAEQGTGIFDGNNLGPAGDQNVYELLTGPIGGPGNANFTGTVKSMAFNPNAAFYDVAGDANGTPLLVMVVLASDTNFCVALAQNGNELYNSTHVVIAALTSDAAGNTVALDTSKPFPISSAATTGNNGILSFLPFDSTCQVALASSYVGATAGSISLATLGASTATGTFNATVGTQADAISGSFAAAPCPGLVYVELSNKAPGCQ